MNSSDLICEVSRRAWIVNLHGAVIVGLVAILSLCPRSVLTTKWRSLLWALVFVRLAIPVSLPSELSLQNAFSVGRSDSLDQSSSLPQFASTSANAEKNDLDRMSQSVDDAPQSVTAPAGMQNQSSMAGWELRSIAVSIWIVVASGMITRLLGASFLLAWNIHRMPVITDSSVIALASECADMAGLSRVPRLRQAEANYGPAVAGWLSPVVIIPRNCLEQLSGEQLRFVLLHEFRHVRTRDTLVAWLQYFLKAVYWCNPAVWFAQHIWRTERELACDAWVLSVLPAASHRAYAEAILKLSESPQPSKPLLLAASMVHFPSLLERRIRAMRNQRKDSRTTTIMGTCFLLLVAAIGLTDRAAATDEATPSKNPVTPVQTETEPVAKKEILRPTLIFAKHIIIWDGTDVLNDKQTIERLAKLRSKATVLPNLYLTEGHVSDFKGRGIAKRAIKIVGEDQWSILSIVQGIRNEDFDRIESQADLDQTSGTSISGQILLPNGQPAGRTQVVLLAKGRWGNLNLDQKSFADPVHEKCKYADADGSFSINIEADDYYVAFFHEDGYLAIPSPLKNGADYKLLPWQTVTFSTHGWDDDQKVEVWVRPEGTSVPCPDWSMKWLSQKDQTVTVKVPIGKGVATQTYSPDGGTGAVTGGNLNMDFTSGGVTTIELPPMTEAERASGKAKLDEFSVVK